MNKIKFALKELCITDKNIISSSLYNQSVKCYTEYGIIKSKGRVEVMGKVFWNGGTLLSPMPAVLVTCADGEKKNVFTVAWTGIINTKPPMTYISVRPSRYSYGIIKKTGEFAINLTTEKLCRAVDFCGVKSGKDIDKFEACKFTVTDAKNISVPILEESPLALECKVVDSKLLGTHEIFIAEIVGTVADERYIDENGRLELEKADLLAYSHGQYRGLGKNLGSFGFSVRKKKKKHKKK